jgi:predicted CopG family antitoxin
MKTINETFTDEEFDKLQARKKNKSWHDFIMELVKK